MIQNKTKKNLEKKILLVFYIPTGINICIVIRHKSINNKFLTGSRDYIAGCSDLVGTSFRFYHILVFHELDLLVLKPFVKKKFIRARPTKCMRGKVFIFKKSQ